MTAVASISEQVWRGNENDYTPDESWHVDRSKGAYGIIKTHWYEASADFAKRYLPVVDSGKLLCVASPIFEARELGEAGWDVTYLDVRDPPEGVNFVKGDAADMPFEAASFDALSSSCVICHVGLGRYGDKEREHGDTDMLRECKRVLKPGALAQITIPVANSDMVHRIGKCHRVYPISEALAMAIRAGFHIERHAIWDTFCERWRVAKSEPVSRNLTVPDHMSMLLRA